MTQSTEIRVVSVIACFLPIQPIRRTTKEAKESNVILTTSISWGGFPRGREIASAVKDTHLFYVRLTLKKVLLLGVKQRNKINTALTMIYNNYSK